MAKLSQTNVIAAPALASFNSKIFLAWAEAVEATVDTVDQPLMIMSSTDGATFTQPILPLPGEQGSTPALAIFRDRLYLAWNFRGSLNVMSSADGITFSNKVTLHELTCASPALAVFQDRLYLAWASVSNTSESVGFISLMSSSDGTTFTDKVTLGEQTMAGLALAASGDRGGMLMLAWTGVNTAGNLNLAALLPQGGMASKLTLSDTSGPSKGPSLTTHEGGFALGYARSGDHVLVRVEGTGVTPELIVISSRTTYRDTSIAAPVFLELLGESFVAWTGTDVLHTLNIAHLNELSQQ